MSLTIARFTLSTFPRFIPAAVLPLPASALTHRVDLLGQLRCRPHFHLQAIPANLAIDLAHSLYFSGHFGDGHPTYCLVR
jgi:hypothetical protein